jgi:hypothetical protein
MVSIQEQQQQQNQTYETAPKRTYMAMNHITEVALKVRKGRMSY